MELNAMSNFVSTSALIVVHPGATCRAANRQIGSELASICRQDLIDTLRRWAGGVVVLDSDRSGDIEHFPALESALLAALERGRNARQTVIRRHTDDDTAPMEAIMDIFADTEISRTIEITLTGAWYEQTNDGGEINRVEDMLRGLGYTDVAIDHSAFEIDHTAMDALG